MNSELQQRFKGMSDQAAELGFTVGFAVDLGGRDPEQPDAYTKGVTNFDDSTITILAGMPDVDTVETLAHELTHALLHHIALNDYTEGMADGFEGMLHVMMGQTPGRAQSEIEAGASSGEVMRLWHLDDGGAADSYLQVWYGNHRTVSKPGQESWYGNPGERAHWAARQIVDYQL